MAQASARQAILDLDERFDRNRDYDLAGGIAVMRLCPDVGQDLPPLKQADDLPNARTAPDKTAEHSHEVRRINGQ